MTADKDRLSWTYAAGPDVLGLAERDFAAFLASLWQLETDPPPDSVASTLYWAIVDGEVVGRIGLRHRLNEFFGQAGGHIGYIVRPSWRGRGLATEMLRQVLATPRAQSIGELLLTCDEANAASERVIRKCGGVYENTIDMPAGQSPRKRFWIRLPVEARLPASV